MRSWFLGIVAAAMFVALCACETKQQPPPPPPPPPPAPVVAPASAPVPMAEAVEEPADYVEPEKATTAMVTTTAKPTVVEIPKVVPKEIFVDSEPPDPVWEEMPKAPGPSFVWTKGYWHWTGKKWTWRHGAWRPKQVGLVYVPAHYEIVNGRVVYVAAHWDKKLVKRSYGGRVVVVRPPVKPVTWKPGMYLAPKPVIGYRIGARPGTYYKVGLKPTVQIVVPPAPPRLHRRPPVVVAPGGVVVRPGVVVPPPHHKGVMVPPPPHGKALPPPPHHKGVVVPPPHHGKALPPPPPPPHGKGHMKDKHDKRGPR